MIMVNKTSDVMDCVAETFILSRAIRLNVSTIFPWTSSFSIGNSYFFSYSQTMYLALLYGHCE
jgi:hypothetical protein